MRARIARAPETDRRWIEENIARIFLRAKNNIEQQMHVLTIYILSLEIVGVIMQL